MRIRKQYQVIPTNAKLENGDSTSATNGYTADYINDHSVVVSPTEPSGSARKKVWKQKTKNLFNKNSANKLNAYMYNNTILNSANDVCIWIPIKSNTKYTISKGLNTTSAYNRLNVGTSVDVPVVGTTLTSFINNGDGTTKTSQTITTGANDKYLIILIASNNTAYQEIADTIQIEVGEEATTYTDYVEDKEYILNNNVYEEFNNKLLVEKRLVQISLASSSATNVTDCAITAPKDGLAIVKVSASFSGGSTGVRYVNIYGENGQLQAIANSQVANQNGTTAISGIEFVNVKAGATYMPRVEQTSGSALTVYCSIQMLYV